jgi:sugar phosphate isomerase/epimerase
MSNLRLIVFTKHFQGMDIVQLIEAMKFVDAEGADLCVRPGYPVNPDNVQKKLPEAVKKFEDAGLSIPLVTTPGDFVDPKTPEAERILAACGEAGVKLIKLGYWFMEKGGYGKTVEKIRNLLEEFVKLARRHEVKVLIHNHSGGTMGLNSSSVMNLVKGFDPRYVGVFTDVGHLSLVGEPLPMALDMVKEYMSAVAVKDLIRERVLIEGKRQWQLRVVPLREGFVDWRALIRLLPEMQFTGPISVHSEYSEYDPETVVDQTRIDIRFLRKLIEEVPLEMGEKS